MRTWCRMNNGAAADCVRGSFGNDRHSVSLAVAQGPILASSPACERNFLGIFAQERCHFGGGHTVLITILIILAIIALALFIWRNMAGRRV